MRILYFLSALFILLNGQTTTEKTKNTYVSPGITPHSARIWKVQETGQLRLVQTIDLKTQKTPKPQNITAFEASQDGSIIITGDSSGNVSVYTFDKQTLSELISSVRLNTTNSSVFRITWRGNNSIQVDRNGGYDLFTLNQNKTLQFDNSTPFFSSQIICNMTNGFKWIEGVCIANCSALSNAINNTDPSNCLCRQGYFWNGVNCGAILKYACSLVKNSDGRQNQTIGGCTCIQDFVWIGGTCQVNCSNISNSIAWDTYTTQVCICDKGYIWLEYNRSCSISQCNGTGPCPCKYQLDYNDLCQFSCSMILHTATGAGKKAGNFTCECIPKYIWNSTRLQCVLNCLQFPFAKPSTTITECACDPKYFWNPIQLTCSQLNCSAISKGQFDQRGGCICESGYVSQMGKCIIDCLLVQFAEIKDNITRFSDTDCNCLNGYKWAQPMCVITSNTSLSIATSASTSVLTSTSGQPSSSINCSKISNSTGTINSTTCNCSRNFYWNSTSNSCLINCSKINKAQSINSSSNNTWTCNCAKGYWWNRKDSQCYRNCSEVRYSRSNNRSDPTYCQCQSNAFLNEGEGTCRISCEITAYSKKKAKKNGECQCQHNYRWDKHAGACVSRNGDNDAVALGVSLGVTLGVLGLASIIFYWYYYRKLKASRSVAELPPPSERALTNVNNPSGVVVTTTTTTTERRFIPGGVPVLGSMVNPVLGPSLVGSNVIGVPPPYRDSIIGPIQPQVHIRRSVVIAGPPPPAPPYKPMGGSAPAPVPAHGSTVSSVNTKRFRPQKPQFTDV